jgi:hypothetical protein
MQILEEIFSQSKPAKILLQISLGQKEKKEFENTVYWNKLIAEKISNDNQQLDIFFKCWKRDKYQLLNFFIITDYSVKLNKYLYPIVISKYVVQCYKKPDNINARAFNKFFSKVSINDYLDYDNVPTSNIEDAQIFSNPEDNFYFLDSYEHSKLHNFDYFQAVPINPVIKY